MSGRVSQFARNFVTSAIRRSGGHDHGGIPGGFVKRKRKELMYNTALLFACVTILENLPFDITNRYKLTALFIVFFGSGLAAPFFVLRHQLLKK